MYRPRNSWRLLAYKDFTTFPTTNMKPDTTQVVDGVSWVSQNMAVASAGGFILGTGMQITANAGAQVYGDNARSSALIYTDLANYVPGLGLGLQRALRIFYRVTLANVNENFEFAKMGIERQATPQQFHGVVGCGWNAGRIIEGQLSTSAVSTRANVSSSDDIVGLTWKTHFNFDFFRAGTWSGEFPLYQEPTQVTSFTSTTGSNYWRDRTDVQPRLVFTAQPTGSATSFTATWTHMAILELVA